MKLLAFIFEQPSYVNYLVLKSYGKCMLIKCKRSVISVMVRYLRLSDTSLMVFARCSNIFSSFFSPSNREGFNGLTDKGQFQYLTGLKGPQ